MDDAEHLKEFPAKRTWTDGFYYLVHPWQTGPLDCKFVFFSSNRNHAEPSGEPCFMLPHGRLSGRDLMLADVMENGAVTKSEIELLERDFHEQPTPADTQTVGEGDIDPADLPDELSTANIAFRAISKGYGNQSATFKNRLIEYLKVHHPDLTDDAVKRIATVANPNKAPGRKPRSAK